MLVILEDGPSARRLYRNPRAVLSAQMPAEVPAILSAIDTALGQGLHGAGWLGYELPGRPDSSAAAKPLAGRDPLV